MFFFPPPFFFFVWSFPSALGWKQSRQTHSVCFKSSVAVGLICFPVGLFHNSTSSSVWASAVSRRGTEQNKTIRQRIQFRAEGTFIWAKLCWYGKVHPQCSFKSRLNVLPFIPAQRQNVKMGYTHKHTHPQERHPNRNAQPCHYQKNLSAFWIKLGVVYL